MKRVKIPRQDTETSWTVPVRKAYPSLLTANGPYGLCGREATLNGTLTPELRSCVRVEMAVLGSPSLIVLVDVKQH